LFVELENRCCKDKHFGSNHQGFEPEMLFRKGGRLHLLVLTLVQENLVAEVKVHSQLLKTTAEKILPVVS
jgi:hypothetical protein